MVDYEKKFLALDLETTHLSPEEGKIIEVGSVQFTLKFDKKQQRVIVEEGEKFESLVNPEIEVSKTVLHLTGITAPELAEAPNWKEVGPKFAANIVGATIVGHNIGFDLAFMRAQGLRVDENQFLDTLEVSQTFLALMVSHSLEFLANEFKLPVEISHRALADSSTSAQLLAGVLNEFLAFPESLQSEIKKYLRQSTLSFANLFLDMPEVKRASALFFPQKQSSLAAGEEIAFNQHGKTVYQIPISFGRERAWMNFLAAQNRDEVVGVSGFAMLDGVPGDKRLISPNYALCEMRFARVCELAKSSNDLIRLQIKVRIMQELGHTQDLSQLKISPAEREFLKYILVKPAICQKHHCRYERTLTKPSRPVFVDLFTFFQLLESWQVKFADWPVLLFDLAAIEQAFTRSLTKTWNLQKIHSALSLVYDLDHSEVSWFERVPAEVVRMANEIDLFFGILHLVYLNKEGEFAQSLVVEDEERSSDRFQKLIVPAQKLVGRLEKFQEFLKQRQAAASGEASLEILDLRQKIDELQKFLQKFFLDLSESGQTEVLWLKFNSEWVDLNIVSVNLAADWQMMFGTGDRVSVIDTELPKLSLNYFKRRLGLENYSEEAINESPLEEFKVHLTSSVMSTDQVIQQIDKLDGSTVVVLPNENQLRKFYEDLSERDLEGKTLIAYKYSGSLAKLRGVVSQLVKKRESDFIFLLTTSILSRAFRRFPPADNLVVLKLPFEAPGVRPEVGGASGKADFVDTVLPRAIHQLHQMLVRFAKSRKKKKKKSREIYILDERAAKSYNREIYKYLEGEKSFRIE